MGSAGRGRSPGDARPYLAQPAAAHPNQTGVKNWELIPCLTDSALAEHAAQEWLDQVRISSPVPYLVALSGGRIAKQFFAAIAQRAKAHDLAHVHFFWADERCVPPEHAESNFLLAQKNL